MKSLVGFVLQRVGVLHDFSRQFLFWLAMMMKKRRKIIDILLSFKSYFMTQILLVLMTSSADNLT